MNENDIFERLNSEFEHQAEEKCTSVALRAAIRGFPPPNFSGNADASESHLIPRGKLLLQALVHFKFGCAASREALVRSLSNPMWRDPFINESSVHLSAIATLERSRNKAMATIENVAASFGTAADEEQFLYAKSREDWSTRHAYDSAFITLTKASLTDFAFSSAEVFNQELWVKNVTFKDPLDQRINFKDFFQSNSFSFWREWHQGFLEGNPLDWELQRKIALIDESIWNSGADAIARKIEHTRARWEVEKALSDIRNSLNEKTSARHGIGGNNPPETIQDERLSVPITLIWEATEKLSAALEQESPAHEWIEAILGKLKSGLAGLLKWSVGKVNLAVGTAVVVGTTKGATVVADAYIAKHPEKIEALIEALERWLPFLS